MSTEKIGVNVKDSFVQIVDGKVAPTQLSRHGLNPADKQPLPSVPIATKQDVENAVTAAKLAYNTWSRVPDLDRKKAVLAFATAIEEHATDLAQLLTYEHGETISEAHHEIELLPMFLRGHADISLHEEIVQENEQRTVVTRYVSLGVVAGIVPWSFSLFLAIGKLAPALLTGNVIILKPSPFAPYGCLKLVELAQQFFPPGVVQSLSGDDDLGPWITSHPGIDKISFTGSTATGKKVMQSASTNLTRVTLELSGNDAAIILPDVDVKAVAAKVTANAFMNTGQVCIIIKRIYVHQSIYEEFRDEMMTNMARFTIGNGSAENSTHGPLQNSRQYERMKTSSNRIKQEGLKVASGGQIESSLGYFVNPMIIEKPADESWVVAEAQYGPVVSLLTWTDERDVIARANASSMGLGASVWSSDIKKGNELAREMQAGSVWVNAHSVLSPMATFGGHKQSGIGSEWGVAGMKSYCNAQTLFLAVNRT